MHAPIIKFAAAAKDNKTLISGPLYKIDALNKNKWGIATAEVSNVLNSIIGNPLKICSGEGAITNEHSCDYAWDPKAEIGKVIAAKQEGDWIHATAEVTDSIAAKKILEGTWPSSWSGFLTHKAPKSEGWLPNIKNKAVTIVRNPAYEQAGYKAGVGASSDSIHPNETIGGENNTMEPKDKGVPDATYTQDQLDIAVAAALDKQAKDSQAALSGMMPRAEAEKMIAAAVETAKTATIEQLKKERLITELVELQTGAGVYKAEEMPTYRKSLECKASAALESEKEFVLKMKATLETKATEAGAGKFTKAEIPAKGAAKTGFTVGRYDGKGYQVK